MKRQFSQKNEIIFV